MQIMSDVEPEKLKVVELRKELTARGLDTKGNKAVLVKRLKQALNKEQGVEGNVTDDLLTDLSMGIFLSIVFLIAILIYVRLKQANRSKMRCLIRQSKRILGRAAFMRVI